CHCCGRAGFLKLWDCRPSRHQPAAEGFLMRSRMILLVGCLAALCGQRSHGDDWAQWMGPTRDGIYYEDGVIESIPADGLKVKWRAPIAGGYAGPAVASGRVYLFDFVKSSGEAFNDPGRRAELVGAERLTCFDAATGKQLWQFA